MRLHVHGLLVIISHNCRFTVFDRCPVSMDRTKLMCVRSANDVFQILRLDDLHMNLCIERHGSTIQQKENVVAMSYSKRSRSSRTSKISLPTLRFVLTTKNVSFHTLTWTRHMQSSDEGDPHRQPSETTIRKRTCGFFEQISHPFTNLVDHMCASFHSLQN